MKSYKITFKLTSKVSFFHIPTFDGILFYAVVREELGDNFMQKTSLKIDDFLQYYPKMPIELHNNGYFIASFAFWDNDDMVETTTSYKRRFNLRHAHVINFGKLRKQIYIAKGEHKSINNPLPIKEINHISFFFRSDDIERVSYLIDTYITGLGKKQAMGYGKLDSYKIEELEDDEVFETIYRPIPILEADAYRALQEGKKVKLHAYRPPYWLPENQGFCLV